MPPTLFTSLETPRLTLRHLMKADLPHFLAYRNDPVIARYQDWEPTFTEDDLRGIIHRQRERHPGTPGQWFIFAIALKATEKLIGDCAFRTFDTDARQAEIGYSLARAYQGQGFASEAVTCVLDYAFATLQMRRIIANTDCENAASVALLDRLGFRREGHYIQNVWFKGRLSDEYHYAVLQEEWLSKRQRDGQTLVPNTHPTR
jgi:RimJ/RimL family protein N-acetyltransferase